jgi:hypothetical protein
MAKAGRRRTGDSVFQEYLKDGNLHPGLQRIAGAAANRGMSLRALAKAAKSDAATVSRCSTPSTRAGALLIGSRVQ